MWIRRVLNARIGSLYVKHIYVLYFVVSCRVVLVSLNGTASMEIKVEQIIISDFIDCITETSK